MPGVAPAASLSRVFSRDGWGWLLLTAAARMLLIFQLTLAVAGILPVLSGWHGSVVQTGSMEPNISPGDVVISSALSDDAPVPVGGVVEFRSPASAEPSGEARNRVHRIVSVAEDGSFVTAGDANADVDSTTIVRDQIIGQARILVPYVGLPHLWIGTGNYGALAAWFLVTVSAILIVGLPPRRRRQREARSGRGVVAASALLALATGAAAVLPAPQVDAAFTTRTATTGNSWQMAPGVDTRGYGNYRSAIVKDKPWAYYPVDEVASSYTAQDASGNNRDGTYSTFGVAEGVGALSREHNRAITLNGTTASTFAAPVASTAPDVFTIELWLKTSTGQGGELASFGNARTGVSSVTSRKLYMGSNGRLNFATRTGAGNVATSPRSYNDNAWHHVVASMGSSGMALYVDGQLVVSNTNKISTSLTGYWRVGGDTLTGWQNRPSSIYFAGSIDEISIYNDSALSSARVQAHYQAALATTTANYPDEVATDKPSLYYHLEEGAAGPILDYSGNRHDTAYPASGITYNVVGVLPKRNNRAAVFNGTFGYLYSATAHADPQVLSVETWFKTTTKRGGQLIGFANTTGANSTKHDRKLYMNNAGRLVFGVYQDAAKTITSPAAYNDGNWHHSVATLSPTGIRLYVDGQLVASDASVRRADPFTGYWHIGVGQLSTWPTPPTSNYFEGSLDEIAVYSTTLGDAQVYAHYRAR